MDEISLPTQETVDINTQISKNSAKNEEIRQNLVKNNDEQSVAREPLLHRYGSKVETAVKFLNNYKVRNSPLSQKMAFLTEKGLTNAEIAEAIARSEAKTREDIGNNMIPYNTNHEKVVTTWLIVRNYFTGVILIGGAAYGLYHVFKRYVVPYVTGVPCEEDRLRNLELKMMDFQVAMNTAMTQLNDTIRDLQVNLQQINKKQDVIVASQTSNSDNNGIMPEIDKLHSEITSLKGLLLNRHQFPATPNVTPLIPSWQMKTTTTTNADEDLLDKADSHSDHKNGDNAA